MIEGNQHFLLGPTPDPSDKRPRNSFGILLGFGQAYASYYAKQDLIEHAAVLAHDRFVERRKMGELRNGMIANCVGTAISDVFGNQDEFQNVWDRLFDIFAKRKTLFVQ